MKKILSVLFIAVLAFAAQAQINPLLLSKRDYHPQVSQLKFLGVTKPLRDSHPVYITPASGTKKKLARKNFEESEMNAITNKNALPVGGDPLYNSSLKNKIMTGNEVDSLGLWEGLSDPNIFPPDPSGDIGNDHYLQMVNSTNNSLLRVMDKSGNVVYGPVSSGTIWSQIGASTIGDPVVTYDQDAQRWILMEIDQSFSALLLAVSQTSDPLGAWYCYNLTTSGMPDYPKLFVWPDGYYITVNEGGGAAPIYVANRANMLTGSASVSLVRFDLPIFSAIGFQLASGVDWDGNNPPPVGAPANILRVYDDAWAGGSDHYEQWELAMNWTSPLSSVLSGPINIQTTPFELQVCASFFNCIAQPSGTIMESLDNIIMHRPQYRNFGSYESMVLNHLVDITGNDFSGIRWAELRKYTGQSSWSIYQEGTFSSPDGQVFMSSIAQDGSGNIALGYSIAGSSKLPSLRVTARLASDPLGQMTYGEREIGTGLSENLNTRWGDYSHMVVDPVDDRTFWYCGEYMGATDYKTKIFKFRLRRDSNDLAVNKIVAPMTTNTLSTAETIIARVANPGYLAQSNFDVSYSVDGGAPVTEVYANTLAADSSIDFAFAATADFSVVNHLYEVKAWCSLPTDSNQLNDTATAYILHLADNDAKPVEISGYNPLICDTFTNAKIIFQNNAGDTLHTLNINYTLNNGAVTTIPWTGNLTYLKKDTVNITVSGLIDGLNSLVCYTSDPNGLLDENPNNDTLSVQLNAAVNGVNAMLVLKTDDYPNETSWDIKDGNGVVIDQGSGYTMQQHIYLTPICLQDTCYTFTIYDSYGDGLSTGVAGYVRLIRLTDSVYLTTNTLANFGTQEVHPFCAGFQCSVVMGATVTNVTNGNNGVINGTVTGGTAPFTYSFNGGMFSSIHYWPNLVPGTYTIVVRDKSNCKDTLIVTVLNTVGINETTNDGITVTVLPNPVEEFLTINITGLAALPYLDYEISDAKGMIVKRATLGNFDAVMKGAIFTADLSSGIYFIRFKTDAVKNVYRFMKH